MTPRDIIKELREFVNVQDLEYKRDGLRMMFVILVMIVAHVAFIISYNQGFNDGIDFERCNSSPPGVRC